MTLEDLIATAAERYQFRRKLKTETAAAYRHALTVHVEARDFAAAHELRIGKLQAEWAPDDVRDFQTHVLKIPRARQEFAPGQTPIGIPVALVASGLPVADGFLFKMADFALTTVINQRIADPHGIVPILITALLMDGSVVATSSPRGDRVAVLRYLARNSPLFGFFVTADMFLHQITDGQAATKTEGIIMHVGSRERRLVRIATYARTPAGVVFAPTTDMVPNAGDEDPYAEVFVSVPPPPAGPPM